MNQKPAILIVDDNEAFLELFTALPETGHFHVTPATSAKQALRTLESQTVDLIISDIQMPEMTGIELFKSVQDTYPDIPVILVTAYGSAEQAIQAVRQGAFHYFEKPIDDKLDLFWTTVREALSKRALNKELAGMQRERDYALKTAAPIIGKSVAIGQVIHSIKEVAKLPATVLIYGETGTGKELVARSIHQTSDRRSRPFFAISCNEFSPGVLESELFGHEKGAFTGAVQQKKGLFEIAHRGTLFLDEIGDAAASFQAKLLRVLESKSFTRVGGTKPLQSDFRIITATNQDLKQAVDEGRFRKDLFFRINVYTIDIPPLRDRREDIPLIAEYYLKRFGKAYGRSIDGMSENALAALRMYDWPGNVRELINVVERAVITCNESMLTTRHLPFDAKLGDGVPGFNLKDVEKFYIDLALQRTANNKTKAAELLGISRKTLIEKVKIYQLAEEHYQMNNQKRKQNDH